MLIFASIWLFLQHMLNKFEWLCSFVNSEARFCRKPNSEPVVPLKFVYAEILTFYTLYIPCVPLASRCGYLHKSNSSLVVPFGQIEWIVENFPFCQRFIRVTIKPLMLSCTSISNLSFIISFFFRG